MISLLTMSGLLKFPDSSGPILRGPPVNFVLCKSTMVKAEYIQHLCDCTVITIQISFTFSKTLLLFFFKLVSMSGCYKVLIIVYLHTSASSIQSELVDMDKTFITKEKSVCITSCNNQSIHQLLNLSKINVKIKCP